MLLSERVSKNLCFEIAKLFNGLIFCLTHVFSRIFMVPVFLAWPKSIPLEVMFEAQQKFLKENQYRYFLVELHWMYPMHSTLVENPTFQLNIICQVALWISALILKILTLMRCIRLLELSKHWISWLQPGYTAVFMITRIQWLIHYDS